jgi:hypothetical protein
VFVIEFIAAGKSSRAVIRRGGFRFVERISVAGQVLTILDEKNQVVKGYGSVLFLSFGLTLGCQCEGSGRQQRVHRRSTGRQGCATDG